jgi:co-chaperonin GroES (HSP10)
MIVPLLHRILVKQDSLEEKDEVFARAKKANIIIDVGSERDREQAAIDSGEVVSIGPTAFRDFGFDTPPIKVGDFIVFAKYGGKTVVDPETKVKYVVLNDEDVVALFTEGA